MKNSKFLSLALLLALLAACAPQKAPPATLGVDDPEATSKLTTIKSLSWKTTGGGDLAYSIEPATDGTYTLKLLRLDSKERNESLTIRDRDGDVFTGLDSLFKGKLEVKPGTTQSTNPPTGTWSSVTLIDSKDHQQEIKSPGINTHGSEKLFDLIRDLIDQKFREKSDASNPIDPNSNPKPDLACAELPDLAGTLKSESIKNQEILVHTTSIKKTEGTEGSEDWVKYSAVEDIETKSGNSEGVKEWVIEYAPKTCIVKKHEKLSDKIETRKIILVKKSETSTEISSALCDDDACSKKGDVLQSEILEPAKI